MQQQVDMKWVGIGAVVIIVLNQVVSALLAETLVMTFLGSGLIVAIILTALVIALLSFFIGGAIVGYLSPGETLKEPGYACLIAIALNVVINMVVYGQFPGVLGILIVGGIGYGMGMAGAWVGEKLQGDTAEKQRAREEDF